MTEPRTAPAAEHPCEWYAHSGAPKPVRTQAHHRLPIYLQKRLYGEVRHHYIAWSCGLCHDSIHAWLSYLLGEAYRPNPEPGPRIQAEAAGVKAWYDKERAK